MSDVSAEAHENFRIVVNGELKSVYQEVLTYEEVVQLAFPDPGDKIYSVTFEKARHPHEGELLQGQHVEIENGTEFDVEPTGRS
jgi:hypothetical protein